MTALPPDCVQVAPDIAVPGDVGFTCAVLQYLLVAPLLQMTMSALDMPLSPTPMPTHASWDRITVNSIVVLSLEILNVPESLSSNVNAPALSSDAGDGLDDCGDGLDDCGDGEVAEGVGEPPAAFDKVTFWATHILSIDPIAPHKPYTSIVASPVAVQGMSLLVAFADPPELAFVVPALILSPRPPV